MCVFQFKCIMLKKLKKRTQFVQIAKARFFIKTQNVWIQYLPASQTCLLEKDNHNNDCLFVGYTASRKVGGAVSRNRAKRRLREIVRQYLNPIYKNKMSSGAFVFIALPNTVSCAFADLARDIDYGVKKCIKKYT